MGPKEFVLYEAERFRYAERRAPSAVVAARVPASLVFELRSWCEANRVSPSFVIVCLIRQFLRGE